ncbi:MAG TPA: pseudouridine synthase [Gammaproteobacteria bacterium]|nr:pseudouridine synthase [Gammaproteobacteria bacterium]
MGSWPIRRHSLWRIRPGSRRSLSERVQKYLANAGAGSRREIERWIAAGRLRIDGRVAQPGDRVSGTEHFRLDDRDLQIAPPAADAPEHVLYYKPAGEITTRSDPDGRRTVFDSVPPPGAGRWITVGRLDLSTSGLLLLTTDGQLAHRLMHPGYEIPRTYAVRILGRLTEAHLEQLRDGIELDDGPARASDVRASGGTGANAWYDVTLSEGRNREVRRLFEALGFAVNRLIRIQYGPLKLSNLRRKQSRPLTHEERKALYASVGLRSPVPPKNRHRR